jgi:hypothetical protein
MKLITELSNLALHGSTFLKVMKYGADDYLEKFNVSA